MAHLTTAGLDLWFDPSRINLVMAGAGGRGAAVYGITDGVIQVDDAPVVFLQGLGIDRQFAQLTRPDNSPVWLKADGVAWVRAPVQGEYPASVQSVVNLDGRAQGVTEALPAAVTALKQAGAPI